MAIIDRGKVIEKFDELSAEEFEKWCNDNRLTNESDGIVLNSKYMVINNDDIISLAIGTDSRSFVIILPDRDYLYSKEGGVKGSHREIQKIASIYKYSRIEPDNDDDNNDIQLGLVIEKFRELSIDKFEKWCAHNNLFSGEDGERWSTETHRGFTITVEGEDLCVTIRHHVRVCLKYTAGGVCERLLSVPENNNRSIIEKENFDDKNAKPFLVITENYRNSQFVDDDPNGLMNGV